MIHLESSVIGEGFIGSYNIGDVVKFCGDDFCESVEIKTGIILNFFNITLSEREYCHADVYVIGYDRKELVLLGNLILLYKI
tara:strand:+ start:229 stop:474 length:246 start_codon:yes stop_codon:yes gene_type:complete